MGLGRRLTDWSAADRATLGELLVRLRQDLSKSRLSGREES